MKKLSKKERHEIYKKALSCKMYRDNGLCYLLKHIMNEAFYLDLGSVNQDPRSPYRCYSSGLTEYALFFNSDYESALKFEGDYWKPREIVLQLCIEMTK